MRPILLAVLLLVACSDQTDPSPRAFADAVAAGRAACAFTVGGQTLCWGDNSTGGLGTNAGERELVPTLMAGNPSFAFLAVGRTSCGIDDAARAFCWGEGGYGNLGTGSLLRDQPVPQAVRTQLRFRQVATALTASCGIAADSTAWCWGEGRNGMLGAGEIVGMPVGYIPCNPNQPLGPACAAAPIPVAGGHRFIDLAIGGYQACAIASDERAYCWGYGVPGNANGAIAFEPVPVPGIHAFTRIARGGEDLACGLTPTGKARCWGAVVNSPSGQGGEVIYNQPEPAEVDDRLTFSELAVGDRHACGVTPGGTAWCWGANVAGALGDGTTEPGAVDGAFLPTVAGGDLRFAEIAAGADFTCGVSEENLLYCWGSNGWGQVGDGSLTARLVPTPVSGQGE